MYYASNIHSSSWTLEFTITYFSLFIPLDYLINRFLLIHSFIFAYLTLPQYHFIILSTVICYHLPFSTSFSSSFIFVLPIYTHCIHDITFISPWPSFTILCYPFHTLFIYQTHLLHLLSFLLFHPNEARLRSQHLDGDLVLYVWHKKRLMVEQRIFIVKGLIVKSKKGLTLTCSRLWMLHKTFPQSEYMMIVASPTNVNS